MGEAQERRWQYDRLAQSMVGLRLEAVHYVEIDSSLGAGDAEPTYDRVSGVDTLDFGLDLVFENGRVVGFTWGQEFEIYDLELVEGGIPKGDAAVWDHAGETRWSSFVGSPIDRVDVDWIEDEEESIVLSGRSARVPLLFLRRSLLKSLTETSPSPLADPAPEGLGVRARFGRRVLGWAARNRGTREVRQRLFPLGVCLHFADRRLWIGALEASEGGGAFHCADTVTVAFDEDVARELGFAV